MDQLKMYIDRGIYYSTIEREVIIDLDDAKQLVERRKQLLNGNKYPGCFEISKLQYQSKQAREYLSKYGSEGITASAVVANTTISRIFISVYFSIYPTSMPHKVFADKSKAIAWLQQFVGK